MVFRKEIVWGGRVLSLETGRVAYQASGAVMVRYADTTVLCTVVASEKQSVEQGFFPLTVNYIEKAYSAGKIPGGFVKREGRPSERETLVSRLIDRPIRPLFHQNFKNETQVICTVLSFDGKNDPDIVSIIGASAALTISGVPFLGPIAASRIGFKNEEFVLNPVIGSDSHLDLVMAGTRDGVLMVESEAHELSEKDMLRALKFGYESFQPVIDMILTLAEEAANDPWEVEPDSSNDSNDDEKEIMENFLEEIKTAYGKKTKHDRNAALSKVFESIVARFSDREIFDEKSLSEAFSRTCSTYIRDTLFSTGKRIDGRSATDIREISIDVPMLPMVHGSAMFTRGETQALAITTLGTSQDEQIVDALAGEYKERFLLHYNFPPFSVGEIGRLVGPGRREIGHGRLAWRAISGVLPSKEVFPYSIRVVSEVLSCNGSSSMASVCGASLALMDAGVPLKNPVAGIAMGLVMEDDKYIVLSDIMGEEDHLGDMDFKVAGTRDGITALQMDIKVSSISFEILKKALEQAKDGRLQILGEMDKVLAEARTELNKTAPKMSNILIPKEKIREVIGSGGKVIKEIIERSGAKIDIDDDGNVSVYAQNTDDMNCALDMIKEIAFDPVYGTIYRGKVVKIMEFGAFVNFFGTKDGLVHISEMSDKRVEKVTDIVNETDEVDVLFLGYDNKGRAKLTMKIRK
ncbi:MAG: polyribonucleotide nucleotidyltransferase [Holosporaceae bacterium]|jgi:polyribonucleotide nucleotidyltransferase|nr:polyribonucleotide nucleotidyltransferase [Holosporaceae bacterium]